MELYHLVLSTVGHEPLFLEPAARREALRATARVAGPRLWAFGMADDHGHWLVEGKRPTLLGGHLALALAALPGAPGLQPSWAEPVEGREHLKRLLVYLLRQPEHHGLGPSAGWEGTSFLDLVGARRLAGFDATRWRQGLPREDDRLVWDAVRLERPTGVRVAGHSLETLVTVAARSVAADQGLRGQSAVVLRARAVALALGQEGGFGLEQIAAAIACSPRQARRYVGRCDEEDLRAARRGLAIEAALLRQRAKVS